MAMPSALPPSIAETASPSSRRRIPGGLAGAAFWIAVGSGLLWLLRQAPGANGEMLAWMQLLAGLALIGLAVPLAWKLIRTRLLWSLRSKLVLTYLLIGLAPVVLFVTLAAISAYIAAGQFSIHLADTRMRQELTEIASDNSTRIARMARFFSAPEPGGPGRRPRPGFPGAPPNQAQANQAQAGQAQANPAQGNRGANPAPVQAAASGQGTGTGSATSASGQAAPPLERLRRQTTIFLNGAPLPAGTGLPGLGPSVAGPQAAGAAAGGTGAGDGAASADSSTAKTPLGLPPWASELPRKEFRGVVLDGTDLYLVAINQRKLGDGRLLSAVTSLPVDSALMDVMAQGLGRVRMVGVMTGNTPTPAGLNSPDRARTPNRTPMAANDPALVEAKNREAEAAKNAKRNILGQDMQRSSVYGGTEPPPVSFADVRVPFLSTEGITDWETGDRDNVPIEVDSRPSLLYRQLFGSSLSGIVTSYIRNGLVALCIAFALMEALALWLALRVSRAITTSVEELYEATQRVDRGDFAHRIAPNPKVQEDQLGELARSFNRMTGSLERLLVEQKEKERLQSELSIAQEVQANLFPNHARDLPTLELHGICRPARSVSGDYYDFLVFHHASEQHAAAARASNGNTTPPERDGHTAANGRNGLESGVGIVLGDISGKGISAALLMATLHSAVRAYRFASEDLVYSDTTVAGLIVSREALAGDSGKLFESPGRILSLLNRHLYRSTQPEKYATIFLAHYDAASAQLTYSNAGHLPPLVLGRDGKIRRLDCGGTVVGLMDGMRYEEGRVAMSSGDILVAYSDGVTEPENDFGEFGEDRLMEVVARYRDEPLEVVSAQVMLALDAWIGAEEQPDDITLVLARQV
jgi:sigma-B regulation protein RsbU (phosphoserine phosphatase)